MNDYIEILKIVGSVLGTFGALVWWLSGQFSKMRGTMYEIQEKILNKLEYHEQHDDSRFNAVNNDLWAIKLRNAGADDFARRLMMDVSNLKDTSKKDKEKQ